jgi:hypothetical protein
MGRGSPLPKFRENMKISLIKRLKKIKPKDEKEIVITFSENGKLPLDAVLIKTTYPSPDIIVEFYE